MGFNKRNYVAKYIYHVVAHPKNIEMKQTYLLKIYQSLKYVLASIYGMK